MSKCVLITGGAGFIGRRVVATLLEAGHEIRVLDNFHAQIHGDHQHVLTASVEVCSADIRDRSAVARALPGIDLVVHLAAEVGVGQSMYEIERYTGVNELGTAVLMEELVKHPVERVVVASSMSIYGEGLYEDADGRLVEDARRFGGAPGWDPVDRDGRPLRPVATPEWKRAMLSSIYALNKYAQEQMTMIAAPAYGIEAVALRLFNVFGPGQALSNPYTGVLAIFASRILNRQPPLIFEDGEQRRDFVHVDDVAEAFRLALEVPAAAGKTFNIGSGVDRSIADVAESLTRAMGHPDDRPVITQKARTGDIRHCFADIGLAAGVLGFRPQRSFEDGLPELAEWVATQTASDRVAEAHRELEERGLVS